MGVMATVAVSREVVSAALVETGCWLGHGHAKC